MEKEIKLMGKIWVIMALMLSLTGACFGESGSRPFASSEYEQALTSGDREIEKYVGSLDQDGKGRFLAAYLPGRCFTMPIATELKFFENDTVQLLVRNWDGGMIQGKWTMVQEKLRIIFPPQGMPEDANSLSGESDWILKSVELNDKNIKHWLAFEYDNAADANVRLYLNQNNCSGFQ